MVIHAASSLAVPWPLLAACPLVRSVAALAADDSTDTTQLWIGAATIDITPKPPVALTGFQTVRITSTIQSPLTANVLALESRDGDRVIDQAILISCDLCVIRPGVQDDFRNHVAGRLPGFDIHKLFLAATHTHSAPVTVQSQYDEKDYGNATQPKEYLPYLYQQMAEAVVQAWTSRAVGAVGHGLGHAVIGQNRRIVYADGRAQMSFETNDPQFRHFEGYEDHGVDILCFYDGKRQLKATAITLACTAQMSQGETVVSADFWHDARELLRARYGKELCVLGFCAPAGDQCPHLSYRKTSETRMDQLRGLTRTQELGRRIAQSFFDVADLIAQDVHDDVPSGPPGAAGHAADADHHGHRIRDRQESVRWHRHETRTQRLGRLGPPVVRRSVRPLSGPGAMGSGSMRWNCTYYAWEMWPLRPIHLSCTSTTVSRFRPVALPNRLF